MLNEKPTLGIKKTSKQPEKRLKLPEAIELVKDVYQRNIGKVGQAHSVSSLMVALESMERMETGDKQLYDEAKDALDEAASTLTSAMDEVQYAVEAMEKLQKSIP